MLFNIKVNLNKIKVRYLKFLLQDEQGSSLHEYVLIIFVIATGTLTALILTSGELLTFIKKIIKLFQECAVK